MVEETRQTTYSINSQGKSMVLAYALWWFLGWAGAHRYLLGRPVSATIQASLSIIGTLTVAFIVGLIPLFIFGIWWMADAYFVQKYVKEYNLKNGYAESAGFSFTTKSTQTSASTAATGEQHSEPAETSEPVPAEQGGEATEAPQPKA